MDTKQCCTASVWPELILVSTHILNLSPLEIELFNWEIYSSIWAEIINRSGSNVVIVDLQIWFWWARLRIWDESLSEGLTTNTICLIPPESRWWNNWLGNCKTGRIIIALWAAGCLSSIYHQFGFCIMEASRPGALGKYERELMGGSCQYYKPYHTIIFHSSTPHISRSRGRPTIWLWPSPSY